MWNDQSLLQKLKKRDSESIYHIYEYYYPVVKKLIVDNSGSSEEAKDIFQEVVLVLLNNVAKEDFELTSSFKTYIYSIARNLWLKKIRECKKGIVVSDDLNKYSDFLSEEIEQEQHSTDNYVRWIISKIPIHCQRIVKYIYFFKYSVETVAGKMGYNSTHTASNMKYKCLKQMKEVTKINPIYLIPDEKGG